MSRVLGLTLSLLALAAAHTAVETFRFDAADLEFLTADGGIAVTLPGSELVSHPGAPSLPEVVRLLPLPEGTRLDGVEVESVEFEDVPGRFRIAPVSAPAILSLPCPAPTPADTSDAARPRADLAIYAADALWPRTPLVAARPGFIRGRPVVALVLRPVSCAPASGQLRLARSITVRLTTTPASTPPILDLTGGPLEHLIVTAPGLDTVFARLADWRTQTGLRSAVRTLDRIVAVAPGRDDAEKLRNYLKSCLADSGLRWLLLGGDVELIPVRTAFAMTCSAGIHPREDSLPCDYYYSDLDGDWDANANGLFGEVADSVDMFPDVFVGRAPVRTPAEARAFVDKLLTYETSRLNDYQCRALFAGLVLWEEPFTDEGIAKDRIDSLCVPPRFDPIRKLYGVQMEVTRDTVVAELNSGFGLFNHCGHGWIDALGLSGREHLRNPDVAGLFNAARLGVGYSIGCWTTAFDYDAIAEEFVRNPQGGAVAFIGNSSYGWGAPGNPGFGYSDRYDARFFAELFGAPGPRVGKVLARVKAHYAPLSAEANVFRWHQYCINLIGDPAMPVHTDTLAPIHAELPLRLPVGEGICRIVVRNNSGPLSDATVFISGPDGTDAVGRTGRDGTIVLKTGAASAGRALITISAPNHRPRRDSVLVVHGPHIAVAGLDILDADSSGWLAPGESFSLRLKLVNAGTTRSTGLRAFLSSDSPLLGISSDFVALPGIAPAETLERTAFAVGSSSNAADGATALCRLRFVDSLGAWWDVPFVVTFSLPRPVAVAAAVSGRRADTVSGRVRVANAGLAPVTNLLGSVFRYDDALIPTVPALAFPNLAPGETAWSRNEFEAILAPGFRLPLRAKIGLNLTTAEARCGDTLTLLIGQTGLSLSDTVGWTSGGEPDIWRRTPDPEWTWHTGREGAPYPPNCNSWLLSPGFALPESAQLRFQRRFGVPIYGSDGMFVIVACAGREETLDFIGSGGALRSGSATSDAARPPADPSDLSDPSDGIVSGWFEETYNLSRLTPGDSARIRFSFVSDADPAGGEGFFVSRVSVASAAEPPSSPLPDSSRLLTAFPNPFRKTTTIIYAAGPQAFPGSCINLRIYDRSGRIVRVLDQGPASPGYRALVWDGRDDSGRLVSAGVYFLKLAVRCSESPDLKMLPAQTRLRLVLVR